MKMFKLTDWLFILVGLVCLIQGIRSNELSQLLERLILGFTFVSLPFIWDNDKIRKIIVSIMMLSYLFVICMFD